MISSDVMPEIIELLRLSKRCYRESQICMTDSVLLEAKSVGLSDEADALLSDVFENVSSAQDLKQIYDSLGITPIKHSTYDHKTFQTMTFDELKENMLWDIKSYFKGYRVKG